MISYNTPPTINILNVHVVGCAAMRAQLRSSSALDEAAHPGPRAEVGPENPQAPDRGQARVALATLDDLGVDGSLGGGVAPEPKADLNGPLGLHGCCPAC